MNYPNPLGVDVPAATGAWSPYPGLRPFQTDDSEYFYGRDAQVDDIVKRLRDNRFVAVIGGSGSGKSSLVLAGAIPRLRTFAIKDAGDFWAPVIATPGTNHIVGDTPVRRLARKFCGELTPAVDAAASAERLQACVDTLRETNGLGALVERFGAQLRGCDGFSLDALQVNFLFLFDQFEELFHPSNVGAPVATDCTHLVNRIVEQFKRPHPQVCVALTMRSEHLNDCPRYDALPDAINAASYLVKRLDAGQLADAIRQPVLRYLRKQVAEERAARRQARLNGRGVAPAEQSPLPDQIPIDDALVERLVTDSCAVLAQQDHADHLPLLQHLLFWIWHQASERCTVDATPGARVDAITLDDMWHAVGPQPGVPAGTPLPPSVNTLQACLETRCEAIFASRLDQQALWESVFRSLAFKEPNTGTYTQQRAAMADLRQRLGPDGGGIDGNDDGALAARLQPWLAPHGYLHWDTDSRTVKVAHETLIRRWERFRHWIDEEDRQFHVYLRLLEDCERWRRAGDADWALSGGDTLRRYEDAKLSAALTDPARVARIGRLLGMDRDGRRLSEVAGDALRFLTASIEYRRGKDAARQRAEEQKRLDALQLAQMRRDNDVERAKNAELLAQSQAEQARNAALESHAAAEHQRTAAEKEKAGRLRFRSALLLTLLLGLLPSIAWIWTLRDVEALVADKERTLHRSYALAAESQVDFQPSFKALDGPQGLLRYTLIGAWVFELGRHLPTGVADWLLFRGFFAERLEALANTERFSESRNTASLRTILQGAVWALPAAAAPASSASPSVPADALPAARGARRCATLRLADDDAEMAGRVGTFYSRPGVAAGHDGLIVVTSAERASARRSGDAGGDRSAGNVGNVGNGSGNGSAASAASTAKSISVGRIDAAADCRVGEQLLVTPQQQPVRVGVAADAANLVLAFDTTTQFYTVMWDDAGGIYARQRASVAAPAGFAEGLLPTRTSRFWSDVTLDGTTVRLFDVEPSAIDDGAAGAARVLTRLASPAGGSASVCRAFVEAHDINMASEEVWELAAPAADPAAPRGHATADRRAHCLRVIALTNSAGQPVYAASLYALGTSVDAADKDRNLPLLSQLQLGDSRPVAWRLQDSDGWLAFRNEAGAWRAVPWSLGAFGDMARAVLRPTTGATAPPATRHAPAPPGLRPCRRRPAVQPALQPDPRRHAVPERRRVEATAGRWRGCCDSADATPIA